VTGGVFAAVERRAAGRRVTRVRVRVGARHRVVPSAFDQSFALVAQGTVADGAAVDLVVVPVRVRCQDCGHEAEATDPSPPARPAAASTSRPRAATS
jgi:hydrogenase nickel incorporation protein HypA/HybF